MDDQRLEEIAKSHARRYWAPGSPAALSVVIVEAIREALTSQEEELRTARQERDAAHAHACENSLEERDLRQRILQLEEELRSLREERDELLHVKAATAHARDLNQTRAREAEARAESAEAEVKQLRYGAQSVYETFVKDETQGYRSRDRQFAIAILGTALRGGDAHAKGTDATSRPEGADSVSGDAHPFTTRSVGEMT